MDPLLVNPVGFDFGLSENSPCIDAGNPAEQDPDGTRSDMGSWHFPFISISCSPNDVILSPGDVLELILIAENMLQDDSFPVQVELIARLQNGSEYLLRGPIPPSGVPIPAGSCLDGTMRLDVPYGLSDGFSCILKTVLTSSETGTYVDEDRCEISIVSGD
ncbi:MAG: hypothetical protein ACE5OP_07470 [Candidatus Glassbacteria bacterium]